MHKTIFLGAALVLTALVLGASCRTPTLDVGVRTVEGTLQTADGTPVPQFEVTVLETGTTTLSGSDGTFSFLLGDGTYHLYVTKDYAPGLGSQYFSPVTVTPSTVNVGSWKARTPSTLGRAISGDTGFSGVVVTIAPLASPNQVVAKAISSSDESMFAFFDLADGEYLVTGSSRDYALDTAQIKIITESHSGQSVQTSYVWNGSAYSTYAHYGSDNWSVGGSAKPVNKTGGTISGNVYDNNTYDGLVGFTVQLLDASETVLATTTTDAWGDYSFGNLDYTTVTGTTYFILVLAKDGYDQGSVEVSLDRANYQGADLSLGFATP